jgi:hypothetical protein
MVEDKHLVLRTGLAVLADDIMRELAVTDVVLPGPPRE